MFKIKLNTKFLQDHIAAITYTKYAYKQKDVRETHKAEDCLFLTQENDILTYTSAGQPFSIQSYEKVDFQIPYPIIIDLASVTIHGQQGTTELIIPNCTMETLKTFYDDNRPKFIKDKHLTTSVISIGDRPGNLSYIKSNNIPAQFDELTTRILQQNSIDWQQYDWTSTNEHYVLDRIYEIVTGQNTGDAFLPFLSPDVRLSEITFSNINLSQMMHRATKCTTITKTRPDDDGNPLQFETPVALFDTTKQKILLTGKTIRTK